MKKYLGLYELAKCDLDKALSIDPKYERSYFVLGMYYQMIGHKEESIKQLQLFLSFNLDEDFYPVKEAQDLLDELYK